MSPANRRGGTYCFWCGSCRPPHSFLCALYLLNQLVDFYQTCTDTLLGWGKEVIRFWWSWPHFEVASCLHSISWTSGWILTKCAQTHYWDGGKKRLDFGDLDLIFKVTPALWNFQILTKKSLEPNDRFWSNFKYCDVGMVLKIWLDFSDLDLIFKVTHYKDCKNGLCLHSI